MAKLGYGPAAGFRATSQPPQLRTLAQGTLSPQVLASPCVNPRVRHSVPRVSAALDHTGQLLWPGDRMGVRDEDGCSARPVQVCCMETTASGGSAQGSVSSPSAGSTPGRRCRGAGSGQRELQEAVGGEDSWALGGQPALQGPRLSSCSAFRRGPKLRGADTSPRKAGPGPMGSISSPPGLACASSLEEPFSHRRC